MVKSTKGPHPEQRQCGAKDGVDANFASLAEQAVDRRENGKRDNGKRGKRGKTGQLSPYLQLFTRR
jgi:hypothetical protein